MLLSYAPVTDPIFLLFTACCLAIFTFTLTGMDEQRYQVGFDFIKSCHEHNKQKSGVMMKSKISRGLRDCLVLLNSLRLNAVNVSCVF